MLMLHRTRERLARQLLGSEKEMNLKILILHFAKYLSAGKKVSQEIWASLSPPSPVVANLRHTFWEGHSEPFLPTCGHSTATRSQPDGVDACWVLPPHWQHGYCPASTPIQSMPVPIAHAQRSGHAQWDQGTPGLGHWCSQFGSAPKKSSCSSSEQS